MSSCSIEDILEQIDDELSGPGVPNLDGIRKKYFQLSKIPAPTLRRAYYRKIISTKGPLLRSRLNRTPTDLQEQALVYSCQIFASMNLGLKPKELLMTASKTWNLKLSPGWARSFMNRHKNELTVRRCQALCKARNNTSHFLQPCDSYYLAQFNTRLTENHLDHIRSHALLENPWQTS